MLAQAGLFDALNACSGQASHFSRDEQALAPGLALGTFGTTDRSWRSRRSRSFPASGCCFGELRPAAIFSPAD